MYPALACEMLHRHSVRLHCTLSGTRSEQPAGCVDICAPLPRTPHLPCLPTATPPPLEINLATRNQPHPFDARFLARRKAPGKVCAVADEVASVPVGSTHGNVVYRDQGCGFPSGCGRPNEGRRWSRGGVYSEWWILRAAQGVWPFVELAVGAAALYRGQTRAVHALVVAAYGLLFLVALWLTYQGYPSCGCFGRLRIPPPAIATVDALVLAGLVSASARRSRQAFPPVAALLLGPVLPLMQGALRSNPRVCSTSPAQHEALLAKLCA